MSKPLPPWLISLTAVLVVFNLLIFGLSTLIFPQFTFPDAGDSGIFPAQFFAVRHIAFAVPLLHGLIRRDAKILTVMYTIFLVMAILDVLLLALNGYYIPLVISLVGELPFTVTVTLSFLMFIVPMGLTLRYLRHHHPKAAVEF